MRHNVFCKEIPLDVLWTFLEDVCVHEDTYFFIDKNMFAKMIFERKASSVFRFSPILLFQIKTPLFIRQHDL